MTDNSPVAFGINSPSESPVPLYEAQTTLNPKQFNKNIHLNSPLGISWRPFAITMVGLLLCPFIYHIEMPLRLSLNSIWSAILLKPKNLFFVLEFAWAF